MTTTTNKPSRQHTLPWYRASLAYSLYLHTLALALAAAVMLWPRTAPIASPNASQEGNPDGRSRQSDTMSLVLVRGPSPKNSAKRQPTSRPSRNLQNTKDKSAIKSQDPQGGSATGSHADKNTKKLLYQKLRAAIEKHKSYPYQAYKIGLSGHSRIAFVLQPSGKITDLRLLRHSKTPSFDQASLAAVRAASPFALPEPGIRKPMPFVMVIEYTLN